MTVFACSLCTLAASSEDADLTLARNGHAIAVLHDDWAVRGHAMVVSRHHVENLTELEDDARSDFVDLYLNTERALLDVLGVERVILLKLGLAVPHLHWHLYPIHAAATRAEIFEAFECATRDEPDDEAKAALIRALRRKISGDNHG